MDDIRERVVRGDLVADVRRLLQSGAADHGAWIRENVRHALRARRQDAGAVAALTGLAPGTVRGFLNGRPSSIDNVLLIAEAIGHTLATLDQPPAQFRQSLDDRSDGVGGAFTPATAVRAGRDPIHDLDARASDPGSLPATPTSAPAEP